MKGSFLLGTARVIMLAFWAVITFPVLVVAMRCPPTRRFKLLRGYYRGVLWILGISVETIGAISTANPTLFVVNHASYLDVMVLGALLPAAFVSKSEVANWPLFGFLARLQGTVFIERRRRLAAEHRDEIRQRLEEPGNLVIFPEGTSSDGNRVLPFKSTLFSTVMPSLEDGSSITVQPVSLICASMDGTPICRAFRSRYAWYGDMTFNAHLWQVLKTGRLGIHVIFHPPTPVSAFASRKELANSCFQIVAAGVSDLLSGRTKNLCVSIK